MSEALGCAVKLRLRWWGLSPQLSMHNSTTACTTAICKQYLPRPALLAHDKKGHAAPHCAALERIASSKSNVWGEKVNPTCTRLCAAAAVGLPRVCKSCQSRPAIVSTKTGPT